MKKFQILLKVSSILMLVTSGLMGLFAIVTLTEMGLAVSASANELATVTVIARLLLEDASFAICLLCGIFGLKKSKNSFVFGIIATAIVPVAIILELSYSTVFIASFRNILATIEGIVTVVFFLVCAILYKKALDKGLAEVENNTSVENAAEKKQD